MTPCRPDLDLVATRSESWPRVNIADGDCVVPQSYCSIVPGLQHDHVIRLRAESEQHLLVRLGRPDHIASRFPEHLPDQNLGAFDRVHVGLRGHVQQSLESAQVAHESEEKRHQGKSSSESSSREVSAPTLSYAVYVVIQ